MKLLSRKRKIEFTPEEQAIVDQPWFHSYGPLGFYEGHVPEVNLQRQLDRQGDIFRHVRDALLRFESRPRGLMCTVNDGFYGMYAAQKGAASMDIVDVGTHIPNRPAWHFQQSQIAARKLGLSDRVTFSTKNLLEIEGRYDFGIFVNALPNFPNPAEAVAHLRNIISGPLVFQCNVAVLPFKFSLPPDFPRSSTEYDMEAVDEFFYESPGMYVPWGSCFGRRRLIQILVDAGWTIVNEYAVPQPQEGLRFGLRENLLCV